MIKRIVLFLDLRVLGTVRCAQREAEERPIKLGAQIASKEEERFELIWKLRAKVRAAAAITAAAAATHLPLRSKTNAYPWRSGCCTGDE